MRAYYDLNTEIIPGWWKPSIVTVKHGVTMERSPYLGKTDVVIAYPGETVDPRRWKVLPHVELANMDYSPREYVEHERESKENVEAFLKFWRTQEPGKRPLAAKHNYTGHQPTVEEIAKFTRTYGPLFADPSGMAGSSCEISVAEFRDLQEKVRDSWRRRNAKLLWFPRGAEELDHFDLPFAWHSDDLAFRPADLWTYVKLLLTRDLATGHAKVCRWHRCEAPFNVKKRTDWEFCSHECAVKSTNWKNSMKRRRRRHGE